ncbi:adenylate/guanylate cyclase domain-containing protein [Jatrophihabitans sp.]|uniref:adenylate/guanylate cyclase domain-containing protein n=1 Tax=Jatrophihabitans sp. TaxID=1932789 RepID=UPI0030C6B5C5
MSLLRVGRRMHEELHSGAAPELSLALRTFGGIGGLVLLANVAGGVVAGALLATLNGDTTRHQQFVVLVFGGVYGVFALLLGATVGFVLQGRTLRWLARGQIPTRDEARRALRHPLDLAVMTGALWFVGAGVCALLGASVHAAAHNIVGVSGGLVLAGLTTAGVTYLIVVWLGRPITVIALSVYPPTEAIIFTLRTRMLLNWMVTTGIPLLGIILILASPRHGHSDVRIKAGLGAAIVAMVIGSTASSMLSRAIGNPLRRMAATVERIGEGDLEIDVEVDDVGEIGMLQRGLNDMVEGLRERERIQDLFGRHVGPAVAEEAILGGVTLSGESRDVVALFVDITASTSLTRRTGPVEFVGMLNRFFSVVVDAVETHGGLVNKFEGDAALCIFGAPVELENAATSALAAARLIRDEVALAGEVEVGIGVAWGPVIAGQIGAASRLEYTVIGDAVNEAARLTDLAKRVDGNILASEATVEAADPAEQEHWVKGRVFRLRGRDAPTHTYRSLQPAPVPVD